MSSDVLAVFAWSMEVAEKGVGPVVGFYNEALDTGADTMRAKLCHAELAGGRD